MYGAFVRPTHLDRLKLLGFGVILLSCKMWGMSWELIKEFKGISEISKN